MGLRGRRLLDRHSDEAPPFGPGAVVVTDALVAEQVLEHKPGVRAALADAAVRDRLALSIDALAAIDLTQLVRALEATVFGDRCGPRNVLRARDVPAALRAFLG